MAYKINDDCIACGTCNTECPIDAISEGEKYNIKPDVCIECGTCADVCPCDAISLDKNTTNSIADTNNTTEDPTSRLCPCCQQRIEGNVDNPKLRQGARAGVKFAAKQGIKLVAGASVPTAAGATGSAIGGSVIPFVGNIIGFVAGYAIGHVAQEIALDAAYDKLEEQYAAKKYRYYCPECNLTWNSTEKDDRNIVVRNFVEYYEANKKEKPNRPAKFDSKSYNIPVNILYICVFAIMVLVFVPLFHGGEDSLPYHEFISFVLPAFIILCVVVICISVYLFSAYTECKEKYASYKLELEKVLDYNTKLHNDLLGRFNNVISRNIPRLGDTLAELPISRNDEKESPSPRKTIELSQYANVSFIKGLLFALGGAVISIIIACVLCFSSYQQRMNEIAEIQSQYNNNDNNIDTNTSATAMTSLSDSISDIATSEDYYDSGNSNESLDEYDTETCSAIRNFLLGKSDNVVLNNEEDLLECSWPEAQCSIEGTLYSPIEAKNLTVKDIGNGKYRFECECPEHGDKYIDNRTISANYSINGQALFLEVN